MRLKSPARRRDIIIDVQNFQLFSTLYFVACKMTRDIWKTKPCWLQCTQSIYTNRMLALSTSFFVKFCTEVTTAHVTSPAANIFNQSAVHQDFHIKLTFIAGFTLRLMKCFRAIYSKLFILYLQTGLDGFSLNTHTHANRICLIGLRCCKHSIPCFIIFFFRSCA